MSEEKQVISDPSDLKKYRIELPNLADDSDLDVYEFRLLVHYKRVGECTEGLETTAAKCKMSEGKVSASRQALADKGWIHLQRVNMDAGRYRFIVRVSDRWIENFARYSGMSEQEIAEQVKRASPSPREGSSSRHEASPSPREGKKEPIKNLVVVVNAGLAEVLTRYEQEFGSLTPMIADAIKDDVDTFTGEWVLEAMDIAVKANVRRWNYVHGILKACKAKNVKPSLNRLEKPNENSSSGNLQRSKSSKPASARVTQYTDADRAAADAINRQ